jgi:hypothetical protein
MKKEPLPLAEDDSDRKLLSDIQEVGWHIVVIEADDTGPGYAFSVGLFHSYDHPEIIIFGLKQEIAMQFINNIGVQVKSGIRYSSGTEVDELANLRSAFLDVPQSHYREYIGYALWFYEAFDFPVLQCIWPDKSGRFAWEEGYDVRFSKLQPILGHMA